MLNLRWWEPESKKGNGMDKTIWKTQYVSLDYSSDDMLVINNSSGAVYISKPELTALAMEFLAKNGFEVTKKKIRLRHCPLCGGKAYIVTGNDLSYSYAGCRSCGLEQSEVADTPEKAIEHWNALPRGDQRA